MPTKRAGVGAGTSDAKPVRTKRTPAGVLDESKRQFAHMLVEARLPRRAMAQKLGVSRDTLCDWEAMAEVQAEVVRYGALYQQRKDADWLARTYRVQEERLKRLAAIREALAEAGIHYEGQREECATDDPEIGLSICLDKGTYHPGAETGLLMRRVKRVSVEIEAGDESARTSQREVVEWGWAVGLLKEMRALEDAVERENNRMADLARDQGRIAIELDMARERVESERARRKLIEAQIKAIEEGNMAPGGAAPVSLTSVQIVEARRDIPEDAA